MYSNNIDNMTESLEAIVQLPPGDLRNATLEFSITNTGPNTIKFDPMDIINNIAIQSLMPITVSANVAPVKKKKKSQTKECECGAILQNSAGLVRHRKLEIHHDGMRAGYKRREEKLDKILELLSNKV